MADSYVYIYPANIDAPKPDWPALRDRLIEIGFMMPSDDADTFEPGPGHDEFRTYVGSEVHIDSDSRIRFVDHAGEIGIHCGPVEPPSVPGTDRVVEDWSDFVGEWIEDPSRVWTDPETGRSYSLMDLDFGNMFAAFRWGIEIEDPSHLDGPKLAVLVSEIIGKKCRYAHFGI